MSSRAPQLESAVIAVLPEADAVAGRFRSELDPAASWGVPAHVTVLYPFVAPDRIDEGVLARLAGAVAAAAAFRVELVSVEWFDERVLWLAPRPAQPFRDLTTLVHRSFPDHPPYRGAHTELVPHLTIGHDAPVDLLREAERAIAPHLPVVSRVDALRVMVGAASIGSWRTVAEIPLPAEAHLPAREP